MNKSDIRRKRQLEFLKSKENIIVGSLEKLPISIKELLEIDEESSYVKKCFSGGLTAKVYKLEINGKLYNLKKKREKILVKNIDGQTSFLNEVQRRRDFEKIRKRDDVIDQGIIKTLYANLNEGIIFSEWISGNHLTKYNESIFKKLFMLLFHIEKHGIMEWDLCPGNILLDEKNQIKLFDFGYTYTFNPLTEYNSDGLKSPVFHSIERFETRSFFQYLLTLEKQKGLKSALEAYKNEKKIAIDIYRRRLKWLEESGAKKYILEFYQSFVKKWQNGIHLEDVLYKMYQLEAMRSYILELHDDVGGESCTIHTLDKANRVLEIIKENHYFLKNNNGYLWADKTLDQKALIHKYEKIKEKVIAFQLVK